MQLTDIENLSFVDLKEKRAELVSEAAKAEPSELAARYVQARADAKQRDEKLAEQGTTITNLNESLESHRQQIAALKQQLAGCEADIKTAADNIARLQDQVSGLTAQRDDANARADRLKAEATRHATALSTAQKALADATAVDQIEAADKGE